MAHFRATQNYQSGLGWFERDAVVDLDPVTAAYVNRDAPGTLVAVTGEMVFVSSGTASGGAQRDEDDASAGDHAAERLTVAKLLRLNMEKLTAFATEHGITIPPRAVTKKDMAEVIVAALEEDAEDPNHGDGTSENTRALTGPAHHRMVTGGAQRGDEGVMTSADFGAVKRPGDGA